MKMVVNEKGRRRRKPSIPKKALNRVLIWELVRWLLILGPRVIQFVEWLRS
jgi:hypothetical protein